MHFSFAPAPTAYVALAKVGATVLRRGARCQQPTTRARRAPRTTPSRRQHQSCATQPARPNGSLEPPCRHDSNATAMGEASSQRTTARPSTSLHNTICSRHIHKPNAGAPPGFGREGRRTALHPPQSLDGATTPSLICAALSHGVGSVRPAGELCNKDTHFKGMEAAMKYSNCLEYHCSPRRVAAKRCEISPNLPKHDPRNDLG